MGVAWGWVGLFNVPVALIATTLATLSFWLRAGVFALLIFSTGIGPS